MIDIERELIKFVWADVYTFKFKFRNMPYLVCDKFGNFFLLPHCRNKRTSNFKQLDSSKGYIYYQRNKVRMSTLRNRSYEMGCNYTAFGL